jgi:hypothetical protein
LDTCGEKEETVKTVDILWDGGCTSLKRGVNERGVIEKRIKITMTIRITIFDHDL